MALSLFRVTASQTWIAECTCLVLAESAADAESAVSDAVDLEMMDAEAEPLDVGTAWPEGPDAFRAMTAAQATALWLINEEGDVVEPREFRDALAALDTEEARLARIERNNGQLPLLTIPTTTP